MGNVTRGDVSEDNFPLLFLAEIPVFHFFIGKTGYIQVFKIFILAVDPRCQNRDLDIQCGNIFLCVVIINFNHDWRFWASALTHRLAFKNDPFSLDGFDKIHERIGADHTDVFFHTLTHIHLAQTTAQCLLR